MNFKKFFPLSLSFMLLIPISKNINSDSQEVTREVKLKEENLDKQNIYYDFNSTLNENIISTTFISKIKDVSNIDYVSLNEIDREILDEVNYSFDIDLINNEIIYSVSINSISISTSSTFDFSQGIINGEFDQDNLKISLKEISKYTSIEQVGLLDFIKRAAEEAKRAIQEAIRKAEELRKKAIEEARRIAEEIRRRAEEEARKAREIIDRAIGEAKNFVSEVINIKNILTGDIDSISKDIEECKSYKDYSKAKSIYDRAQKTLDKAEELNNKVENKSRSTSIVEALNQINPVRDTVKSLIEYIKRIFNKVKNVFEAIKSEHTARELFTKVVFSLSDSLQNLIWSLTGSIYGGPKGIIENIYIVTTAISNYKYNASHLCDEISFKNEEEKEKEGEEKIINPYIDGYIWHQGYINAKMGAGLPFSSKGCGVVATYNLLKYYGVDVTLSELILRFDLYNAFNLFGFLGTNPNFISKILIDEYGIDVEECGIDGYEILDNNIGINEAGIVCFLYISEEQIKRSINKTLAKRYEPNEILNINNQIDWDSPLVLNNNIPLYFFSEEKYTLSDHFLNFNLGELNFDLEFSDFWDCLVKTQEFGAHYEMVYRYSNRNFFGYNNCGKGNSSTFNDYLKGFFGRIDDGETKYFRTACLAGFYVK